MRTCCLQVGFTHPNRAHELNIRRKKGASLLFHARQLIASLPRSSLLFRRVCAFYRKRAVASTVYLHYEGMRGVFFASVTLRQALGKKVVISSSLIERSVFSHLQMQFRLCSLSCPLCRKCNSNENVGVETKTCTSTMVTLAPPSTRPANRSAC